MSIFKFSYLCEACDESYEVKMQMEEQETWIARCPKCGNEGKQGLYAIAPDGAKGGGCSGCGGKLHGCKG